MRHRVGFRAELDVAPVHQDAAFGQRLAPAITFSKPDLPAPPSPTNTLTAPCQIEVRVLQRPGAGIDLDPRPAPANQPGLQSPRDLAHGDKPSIIRCLQLRRAGKARVGRPILFLTG